MASEMEDLIGKRVSALYVSDEGHAIVFETDQGDIAYVTDADCCSESWFADVIGVPALIGHTVTAVQDVLMNDLPERVYDPGRTHQESDQIYGHHLTTDAGRTDVIYRNSSNGYYGGWITRWQGWDGDKTRLVRVTEDWSAS